MGSFAGVAFLDFDSIIASTAAVFTEPRSRIVYCGAHSAAIGLNRCLGI